jgi:hypothetical protein
VSKRCPTGGAADHVLLGAMGVPGSPPSPPSSVPPARLAELLVSAAATISEAADPSVGGLAPAGMPVRNGRLHLARVRQWLPVDDRLVVVAGFGTACWLGAPGDRPPDLGRHVYRSTATVDVRGRVVLDRRSRAWLAVGDPASFEAVVMPLASPAGLVVVPVEDYARRIDALGEVGR